MAKPFPKVLSGPLIAAVLCTGFLPRLAWGQNGNTQPPPLAGLKVDHVTISVQNLDREADWYGKVLGFKVTSRSATNPALQIRQLRIPGYRIDLVKYEGSTRPAPVNPIYLRQGWIHIGFTVPDLPAALKDLRALHTDVTVGGKNANGVPTRLVVHDPEGNEIELFSQQ